MITVILNCYKRPEYLQEQIEAIRKQTIPPDDIWIWYNKPEDQEQYDLSNLGCKVITCNHNFKFHARFAMGLMCQTKYVAYFDDDTIPGKKWFENCLNTIEKTGDGILGTTGVILNGETYDNNYKVGWNGTKSTEITEVDLVGHAWFLKQKNLKYLWYEKPESLENGEDIQLSYLCQKYGSVSTFVPPHGKDLQTWGSLPEKGSVYGNDKNANWLHKTNHKPIRNKIVKNLLSKGWKTVKTKK